MFFVDPVHPVSDQRQRAAAQSGPGEARRAARARSLIRTTR